jgi:hypothetical protein
MNLLNRKTRNILRPRPRMVYGIEIKKQPTLAYIEATERTAGLMTELLDSAFPGMTPGQIVEYLTTITTEQLKELGARLLSVLPRKTLQILREIVGAQDNPVWDELSPYEHSEVMKAFWEMNDLSAFFTNARNIIAKSLKPPQNTGLND